MAGNGEFFFGRQMGVFAPRIEAAVGRERGRVFDLGRVRMVERNARLGVTAFRAARIAAQIGVPVATVLASGARHAHGVWQWIHEQAQGALRGRAADFPDRAAAGDIQESVHPFMRHVRVRRKTWGQVRIVGSRAIITKHRRVVRRRRSRRRF